MRPSQKWRYASISAFPSILAHFDGFPKNKIEKPSKSKSIFEQIFFWKCWHSFKEISEKRFWKWNSIFWEKQVVFCAFKYILRKKTFELFHEFFFFSIWKIVFFSKSFVIFVENQVGTQNISSFLSFRFSSKTPNDWVYTHICISVKISGKNIEKQKGYSDFKKRKKEITKERVKELLEMLTIFAWSKLRAFIGRIYTLCRAAYVHTLCIYAMYIRYVHTLGI